MTLTELKLLIDQIGFDDNAKVALIVGKTTVGYQLVQVDSDGKLVMADMDDILADIEEVYEEVREIEYHFHTHEVWFGKSADQSGNDWASITSMTPFVATSGNNDWGTATPAKILGTDDTPVFSGGLYYDPHKLLVTANSSSTVNRLRLIWGTDTNITAVAAGQYSSFMYFRGPGDTQRQTMEVKVPRIPVDNKLWLECWNGTNGATISFFIGIHEYNF